VIRAYATPVGETVELGRVSTDAETVQRYWRTHGLSPAEERRLLPLGLALALRGGPLPAVELDPRAVSFHAGHTLSARRPFVAGCTYGVRARIAEVFEKSGRSGPLTVVARTAELYDADGIVVAIDEQQIVRWRAPDAAEVPPHEPFPQGDALPRETMGDLDIGSTIAVLRRRAPGAQTVHGYAGSLGGSESFFSDPSSARRLGFADVIVPGPMQSALFEDLRTRRLPTWSLVDLSLSFRVSVVVGEPIALRAIVIELSADHDRLVADLTLENRSGDRAAVGTATLVA
jgi:hydroxyacyl-ACP dehydratase HTD2-like protein with hotdog domain